MIAKERFYVINAKGVKYSIDLSYYNEECKNAVHIISASNKHLCIDDSNRSLDPESSEFLEFLSPSLRYSTLSISKDSHCNYIFIWIYYTCIFEGTPGHQYAAGSYTNRAVIEIIQPPEGIKFRFDEVHSGSSYLSYTRTTYYTPSGVTNSSFSYSTTAEKHPNTNTPQDIIVNINMYYRFNDSGPWIRFTHPSLGSVKMSYNSTKTFSAPTLTREKFNF